MISVDPTPFFLDDAGVATVEAEPGEQVDLINTFGIGGSPVPPSSILSRVRIYSATAVLYDGPVAAPAFEVVSNGDGGTCSATTYTFTALP